MTQFEPNIFLAAKPGLETALFSEAKGLGFKHLNAVAGGVDLVGGWPDIMRANLRLRGAERVLWRIASFRAMHPAQLDKRSRKVEWLNWLPKGSKVAVEATCRKSKIYHQGAARTRVAGALEAQGIEVVEKSDLRVMVRIEDDLCTISLDTSGSPLHHRGHKEAVGKAPMRETMAALFLQECGYDGTSPVLDPMCGSGTFLIEASEIAHGMAPGRSRAFAFEKFQGFSAKKWNEMKDAVPLSETDIQFFGSDRDAGVIKMAKENAERAGVADSINFQNKPLADLERPEGPPGLVIVNPPYGGRIGNKKLLFGLYAKFGEVMRERFTGWRVGLITSDDNLARVTGLAMDGGAHVAHGGMTVRLWQTEITS